MARVLYSGQFHLLRSRSTHCQMCYCRQVRRPCQRSAPDRGCARWPMKHSEGPRLNVRVGNLPPVTRSFMLHVRRSAAIPCRAGHTGDLLLRGIIAHLRVCNMNAAHAIPQNSVRKSGWLAIAETCRSRAAELVSEAMSQFPTCRAGATRDSVPCVFVRLHAQTPARARQAKPEQQRPAAHGMPRALHVGVSSSRRWFGDRETFNCLLRGDSLYTVSRPRPRGS